MKHYISLFLIALLVCAMPLQAQKQKKKASSTPQQHLSGLGVSINAGLLIPNAKQANFYSGRPGNENTIDRVLRSEQYGTQIWSSLVNQGLISPSAIPSYSAFTIAEYPDMYYKLTYQIGVGIRYDYNSGWGWLLSFDFSQVTAAGQFLLSSDNGVGIPGSRQYVPCDIFGVEKRVLIDFSILRRFPITDILDLEFSLGADINNTKVTENAMMIGGRSYSILDVWGGQSPYAGSGSYDYINQGGIGFGALSSLALGYNLNGSAIDFGYALRYMQTKYKGYNDSDSFALQHTIFFRFNLNNFKLFK
ncbi:MAG: hypothetical protein SPM02_04215 [Bacteroidales bacterium]|nr:hypothetical protein [Bacteroidales bacterium]